MKTLATVLLTLATLWLVPPGALADDTFQAFLGQWENTDSNTRGVTRMEITEKDGKLVAQMWGRCHPTECDWGTTTAVKIDDGAPQLHLLWVTGFKDESQTVSLFGKGGLKLKSHVHFTDESGRKDQRHTQTFHRGWSTPWADSDR